MTQYLQSSQDLVKLLLGGGGVLSLVGSLAGFSIKKHIDALQQANKNLETLNASLEKRNQYLEKQLDDAKAKATEDDVSRLTTIFETLQESNLSSDDAARLKRILGNLRRIQSMQGGFEAYKAAARWMNYRKSDWVDQAVQAAIREYPELIPKKLRKQFKQDIVNYLRWVNDSLYIYGHARASIKEFVHQPSVSSFYPYRCAIDHIKNNGDRQELNIKESTYLEAMLCELIQKIRNEFTLS